MMYFLYLTGFFLARIVPLRVCCFVSEVIARIYCFFAFEEKRVLSENLRRPACYCNEYIDIKRTVRAIFINFAGYLVDFFRFPRYTGEYIETNMDVRGRENLDECLKEGKGAILVTLHLGNWEMGAAIVGALGYDLYAIVLEHEDPRINGLFKAQREINGVKNIPTGSGVRKSFKALSQNKVLAIAADKDYTSTGVEVNFFGEKAVMPRGAAAISLRTGSPIIFTALTREKNGRFRLAFEKPIRYYPTGDNDADIKRLIEMYLEHFEKYICAYPDQWYAFKSIWDRK